MDWVVSNNKYLVGEISILDFTNDGVGLKRKNGCIHNMEIYLDTANMEEIREIVSWGVITGLTTNQKIFLKEKGTDFKKRVFEILNLVDGPVSIELTKTKLSNDELLNEAREYSSWHERNVVIKIPMFHDGRGLELVNKLCKENISTNATCLISTNQVILAALSGATYVSIFFNRVKDSGGDPITVIKESRMLIDEGNLKTKIIVGSLRRPSDVIEALTSGAHIVTVPYSIMVKLPWHWKTEETIKEFDQAWLEYTKS